MTHNLSVLEKLKISSLFLEILDLPTVHLSCFLDQFIPTFSNRNHSAKFQDLKIITKALLANYFETYSTHPLGPTGSSREPLEQHNVLYTKTRKLRSRAILGYIFYTKGPASGLNPSALALGYKACLICDLERQISKHVFLFLQQVWPKSIAYLF